MSICNHEGCNRKVHAKSFCTKHYEQFKKHGKTFSNTLMDFNEIVERKNHIEIIITDKHLKELCRAKIDKEDLPKVKAVGRWSVDTNGYIYNSNTDTRLHRLIMNAKNNEEIDHKKVGKQYKADNRKSNLRVASKVQNQYNTGKRKDNKSGYKGVSFKKNTGKWYARIKAEGVNYYLGVFYTAEEASKAYEKAAKKLHKNFYNTIKD